MGAGGSHDRAGAVGEQVEWVDDGVEHGGDGVSCGDVSHGHAVPGEPAAEPDAGVEGCGADDGHGVVGEAHDAGPAGGDLVAVGDEGAGPVFEPVLDGAGHGVGVGALVDLVVHAGAAQDDGVVGAGADVFRAVVEVVGVGEGGEGGVFGTEGEHLAPVGVDDAGELGQELAGVCVGADECVVGVDGVAPGVDGDALVAGFDVVDGGVGQDGRVVERALEQVYEFDGGAGGVAGVDQTERGVARVPDGVAGGGVVLGADEFGFEAVLGEEGRGAFELFGFVLFGGGEAGWGFGEAGQGGDAQVAEVIEVALGPAPEEAGAVWAQLVDGGRVVLGGAAHEVAGVAARGFGGGCVGFDDDAGDVAGLALDGGRQARDACADNRDGSVVAIGGVGVLLPEAEGHRCSVWDRSGCDPSDSGDGGWDLQLCLGFVVVVRAGVVGGVSCFALRVKARHRGLCVGYWALGRENERPALAALGAGAWA